MQLPLIKALDAIGPLTECATNSSLFSPASFTTHLTHCAMGSTVTGLIGLHLSAAVPVSSIHTP